MNNIILSGAFFVLLLIASLAKAETHKLTINQNGLEQAAFGTTVFGIGRQTESSGIWPCNFWSNFSRSDFADELGQLKLEGGNAAIVLFPFIAETTSPHAAATRMQQLKQILELGDSNGIKLTLRLGYAWDNGYTNFSIKRQVDLLVQPKLREDWYRFCKQTYDIASKHRSFAGAFISWEDFWDFLAGSRLNEAERKTWATLINYPRSAVPARNDPQMEEYFDYFNEVFAIDFFAATQSIFPGLGMEVRSDFDAIFDRDKFLKWYVHKKQFSAPNLKNIYLYWGPYMGARNEGDQISADFAVNLLRTSLERARALSSPDAKFIIAQFNYRDNSPGFSKNSSIVPEQLGDFLRKSAPILRRYCDGVYTWSNHNYRHNAINNGTFSLGPEFWHFSHALSGVSGDRTVVSVFPGGIIKQYIEPNDGGSAGVSNGTSARLDFVAKAAISDVCVVTLGGESQSISIRGDGQWNRYSATFSKSDYAGNQLSMSFSGGAHVDDVVLSNHTQMMGPHDPNYARDSTYADLVWAMTKHRESVIGPSVVAGITEDNWIASRATFLAPAKGGRYQIAIDLTIPNAIPLQTIYVNISRSISPANYLSLKPGNHRLLISGNTNETSVLLNLAFSHMKRISVDGPDLREMSAHLVLVGEK